MGAAPSTPSNTCSSNANTFTNVAQNCFRFSCCVNYEATFDNIPECNPLQQYGNLNFTGFDVEGPRYIGPSIATNTGSHYIRASASQVQTSGHLPSIYWASGFTQSSWYYACAVPGNVLVGTQAAVDCTINVTTTLDQGGPSASGLFTYKAPNSTFSPAPMASGGRWPVYSGLYANVTFDARDTSGRRVDLFIDTIDYTVLALTGSAACNQK